MYLLLFPKNCIYLYIEASIFLMPARIKKERGDITLVAVLAGMAGLTAGIFAGNKLVEVGSRFFPKASDLQTQTYQQPSSTAKPTPVACSDSDGGKISSLKGTTTGLVPDGSAVTIQDTCLLQECLSSDPSCIPQTVLVEHACRTKSNGQQIIDSVSINCPYGCSDGACSQQLTPPSASGCTQRPLCADGEKKTDGSIDYCNPNPNEVWCPVSPPPTPYESAKASFPLVADAYTDRSQPDLNTGSDGFLIVDSSPVRHSYIKAKAEGVNGAVTKALLFLKTTYDGSGNAPAIYLTSNNWNEATLNHNNRPAKIGEALDNLYKVPPYRFVWYDVTSAIKGNGEYSFILSADSSNNTGFYSRESGPSNSAPQLIVYYNNSVIPTPTETPIPTITPSPTCVPPPPPCPSGAWGNTCPEIYLPPGGWICPVTPTPTFTPTITPTKVPITAVVCSKRKYGDANCDGKISGLDYSVWLNSQCYPNQGKICLDLRADFNQDKYIDGLDFVKWLDNRGKR